MKLISIGAASTGGVGVYVRSIVEGINSSDVMHIVIHPSGQEKCLDSGFKTDNVEVRYIYVNYGVLKIFKTVKELKNILKKNLCQDDCLLIHAHTAGAGMVAFLSSIFSPGIEYVYTAHSIRYQQKENILSKIVFFVFEKIIVSKSIKTLCIRKEDYVVYRNYLGVGKGKLRYIHTRLDIAGVDKKIVTVKISNILEKNTNKKYIISIGRVCEEKDPMRFVNIAISMLKECEDYIFIWAGSPDIHNNLWSKIEEIIGPWAEHIYFVGHLSKQEVIALFEIGYLYLTTSKIEGVPISVIESQLYGVPVISSMYRGYEELITNRKTGLLYSSNEEACKKIRLLSESIDLYEYIKKSAKSSASENHSGKKIMASNHYEIYREICESRAMV